MGPGGSEPTKLTNVNGVLYFVANDGITGDELWKSNGTGAGTILVKDIYKGSRSSGFSPSSSNGAGGGKTYESFAVVNGLLFFPATNGLNGTELWKSNGTGAGTSMVKDISFPTPGSDPGNFFNAGGIVYFSATDPYASPGTARFTEMFTTDGTLSGIEPVKGY